VSAGSSSVSVTRRAIRKWIQRTLANDPPRAKSLVVTIFGDSIQPHGGSIRLKGLIDLLAPFGINHRLVRTSVFRLVKEQWLHPRRHGRESSYQLTESGQRRFGLAYGKIYQQQAPEWNGYWTLIALPPNGITPQLRIRLRKELEWQGLRQLAPNLLGHPQINRAALAEVLDRLNARRNIITFQVIDSGDLGTRSLPELVRSSWDLSTVTKSYREFLRRFSMLGRLSDQSGLIAPQEWFIIRTLLIHAFRRIVLHDPLLPTELLPSPWIGAEAYAFVSKFYLRGLTGSEAHLNAITGSSPGEAKSAGMQLRERFRRR
jgi:phenylacetic acid degradation operon negative regulatory protein